LPDNRRSGQYVIGDETTHIDMANDRISTPKDVPQSGESTAADTSREDINSAQSSYRGRFRSAKVPPCLISRNDLRKLYALLDVRTSEALEKHIATLQHPPGVEEKAWDRELQNLRHDARLTVSVHSADGEQISARSIDALSDDQLPDRITLARFDSAAALQFINITPIHRFYVHLDFTEPPTFASYNPWSQPTPNASQIEVIGSDQTWVTGVYELIIGFFRERRRRRGWLHTQRSFNAAHWVIGFPAALWIVYRLNYYVPALDRMHPALLGAIYVYVFLVSLLSFRGIIWLFRWLFPVVELTGSRPKVVRGVLSVVLTSLLLALLYDVLKGIIWRR
jgi:hypothetical protein